MRADPLAPWVGRVFLWLVPAFAAWHFAAGLIAAAQAAIAAAAANAWFPGLVSGWERHDAALEFATRIRAAVGGRVGDLVFPVNARVYSYGLALFTGLGLATDPRRWIGLAVGLAALLGIASCGVLFDLLQQAFVGQAAGLAARTYLPTDFERNLIALGYQSGAILLPAAAPIVAWGIVHRRFLAGRMAG